MSALPSVSSAALPAAPHTSVRALTSEFASCGSRLLGSDGRSVGELVAGGAGKYRSCSLTLVAKVRAVTILTPRLTLVAAQYVADEAADGTADQPTSTTDERLMQVWVKQNDGDGWTAAQQTDLRTRLYVGQIVYLHAWVETNSLLVAAAAPSPQDASAGSSSASPVAVQWKPRDDASPSASASSSSAASSLPASTAASSSPVAEQPLPPFEPRLCLHVISIGLPPTTPTLGAPATTETSAAVCARVVAHSQDFAAATAASASDSSSSSSSPIVAAAETSSAASSASAELLLPSIALGVQEEVARLALLQAQAAAKAEALRLAQLAGTDVLSEKEAHRKANADRQKGEARKRAPKANVNRGLQLYLFLESTFGPLLSQGGGVLDVAGGQGVLSFELSKRDLPCSLVDPREVSSGIWASRRSAYLGIRTKLAADGSRPMPTFRHARRLFNEAFVTDEDSRDMWSQASLVVGLHPDEATEDLVRLSLLHDKPFAVLPCCVFPSMHPNRLDRDGNHVKTFEQLCQYYQDLSPLIERTELPFAGRNTVLFSRGSKAAAARASTAPASMSASSSANST